MSISETGYSQCFQSLTQSLDVPSSHININSKGQHLQQSIQVNITFSQTVTGLSAGDILVTNGTASDLTGTYKVNITPAAKGVVTVKVPAIRLPEETLYQIPLQSSMLMYFQFERSFTNFLPLYPNPSDGKVGFKLPAGIELSELTFEVYNITGQLVRIISDLQDNSIDLSDLNKGLFTLKIEHPHLTG